MILLAAITLLALRLLYSLAEIYYERDWPRATFRGLAIAAGLVILCASAFSQAGRVDIPLQTYGPNVPSSGSPKPQALWVGNGSAYLCTHPQTTLAACQANPITTYTDSTEGTPCPSTAQLVQLPGTTCTASIGTASNLGAWVGSGIFDYFVVTSYGTYGPYTFNPAISVSPGNYVSTTQVLTQTMAGPLKLPAINAKTTNLTENVIQYGADPTGVTASNTAFAAAMATGNQVHIPTGTYLIDNTSGALTVTSFSGSIFGDGPGKSIITCKVLTSPCMEFVTPSSFNFSNLAITFSTAAATCNPVTTNCSAFRNASHGLFIHGGSDIYLSHLYIHDVPGAGILADNGVTNVFASDNYVANTWANATLWANVSGLQITNLSTYSTQDAALELSQYDGESGTCKNVTVNGLTSVNDFTTVNVNSCKNVSISGFLSSGTWQDAIDVRQDGTTTTTVWPDAVNISNGLILNYGAGNPANPAVYALNLITNSTDPVSTTESRVTFSNIDVFGGNTGSTAVFTNVGTTHFLYKAKIDSIRVSTGMTQCYDFTGGAIAAGTLKCNNVAGFGAVVRTASGFSADKIEINNAYNTAVAPQNVLFVSSTATGTVNIGESDLSSTLAPSSVGFFDQSASGPHAFDLINFVTADATTPTPSLTSATSWARWSNNGGPLTIGAAVINSLKIATGTAMTANHGTGTSLQHSDGTGATGSYAKFTADGSLTDGTAVANRYYCGTTTTCPQTLLTKPYLDAFGQVTLAGGTATVTGLPTFSSTTTSQCSCEDTTAPLQACATTFASVSSITVTGNTTDVVKWHCFGN